MLAHGASKLALQQQGSNPKVLYAVIRASHNPADHTMPPMIFTHSIDWQLILRTPHDPSALADQSGRKSKLPGQIQIQSGV